MEALTPGLEDYLEAILTLSLKDKVARVKDIAKSLGVTMPSVVSALNSLADKKLIKHEKYSYVELTEQGTVRAKEVDEHHKLLFDLLNDIMGVDAEIANKDACKIEHHLSDETIKKIKQFIQFLEKHPEEKIFFASRFKRFMEEGESVTAEKKGKKKLLR